MATPTLIFMGRSGSGKGTQARLLVDFFGHKNPPEATLYIETGNLLREFNETEGWTQRRAKEIMNQGGYLPGFLPIRNWSELLIKNFRGGELLILDGCARSLVEAQALDGALEFYKPDDRPRALVFLLEVSEDGIMQRLLPRGRVDDTQDGVRNRLREFDLKVKPVLDFYAQHPTYRFLTVNGNQTIEQIHRDILKLLP